MSAVAVSNREQEMAEACVLFAALMTRAQAEIQSLIEENELLRAENLQLRLAAQINHDTIVGRNA